MFIRKDFVMIGLTIGTGLATAAACSSDDGSSPEGTAGDSGEGGASATEGDGSGGRDAEPDEGSATGGSDGTGGSDSNAGTGIPDSTSEGTLVMEATIDGTNYRLDCRLKEGFSTDLDSLVVGVAGEQVNVACPSVAGVQVSNPNIVVSVKDYAELPPSFSYTEADHGYSAEFEIRAGNPPAVDTKLNGDALNTESLALDCTWDAPTRNLQCSFSGTWGAPIIDFEGEGSLEGVFNVIVPEL